MIAGVHDRDPTVGILLRAFHDREFYDRPLPFHNNDQGRCVVNGLRADIDRDYFVLFAGPDLDHLTRLELDKEIAAEYFTHYQSVVMDAQGTKRFWDTHVTPSLELNTRDEP